MKITVINIANPVIEVFTVGTQGPIGPVRADVIGETSEDITITTQNYLIINDADPVGAPITVQLKLVADAIPIEILNASSQTATIRAADGQLIFYNGQTDQEFDIPAGSVFSFVPKGTTYYVS